MLNKVSAALELDGRILHSEFGSALPEIVKIQKVLHCRQGLECIWCMGLNFARYWNLKVMCE